MAKRQTSETAPEILEVTPQAAIPGGEFLIRGPLLHLRPRPSVRIGDMSAPIVVGLESFVVARVPEGASVGEIMSAKAETKVNRGRAMSESRSPMGCTPLQTRL